MYPRSSRTQKNSYTINTEGLSSAAIFQALFNNAKTVVHQDSYANQVWVCSDEEAAQLVEEEEQRIPVDILSYSGFARRFIEGGLLFFGTIKHSQNGILKVLNVELSPSEIDCSKYVTKNGSNSFLAAKEEIERLKNSPR